MGKLAIASWTITGVAASACVYLYFQLDEEHTHSATLDNRLTELEQHARAERANTNDGLQLFPNSAVPQSQAAEARPASAGTAAPKKRGREKLQEIFRERLGDADSRAKMREKQKMTLMRTHPDLAAALHLQPGEVDRFFDLLADQRIKGAQKNMELGDTLRAQNLPKDEITKRLRKSADAQKLETDKQVALTFGDAKAQEWKDYQASAGVRTQVAGLQSMLRSSGMPLRDDQTESLVKALKSNEDPATSDDQTASAAARTNSMALDPNQRIAELEEKLSQSEQKAQQQHSTLSQYLTPDQLRRSDEISRQQLDNQKKVIQRLRDRS